MTRSQARGIPAQAGIQSRRIALVGAESTGKSRLASELAAQLQSRGLRSVAVPEVLREWCLRAGRAPHPQEQLEIAREQERRVDLAALQADLVIADTTALIVAIYAGMLYEDGDLYRFAIERQRGYDATLLTGLDLPWVPDGLQRHSAQSREEMDTLLRSLLQRAGIGFDVVYGSGPQRLQSALAAMDAAGVLPAAVVQRQAGDGARGAWTWVCDKCSDPVCEHRLFTRLREART
jgi:nicotinamide riboside kinase